MMTMTKRKSASAAQAPAGDNLSEQLATLRGRQKVLEIRERGLLSDVHSGVPKGAMKLDDVNLLKFATKLLSGRGIEIDEDASPLEQVQTELQVVRFAADELDRKLYLKRFQQVHDAFQQDGREWRECVRATALSIAQIQGHNRKRIELAQTIRQGTNVTLPCEFPVIGGRLLGLGKSQVGGDGGAYEFLRQAMIAGIVTEAEIDQARETAAK